MAAYDHFAGTIFDTNKNKNTLSDEDIAAAFTEMQLDVFRNDPLYKAAFDHGDFGDIGEADFDIFAKVKNYIADTIFATDNLDSDTDTDTYNTSDSTSEYVDVSDYWEEWTPPKMYAEPADIEMPSILQQYDTYVAPERELLDHTHEDYPVDLSDPVEDIGSNSGESKEVRGKVKGATSRWKRNVREIVGKDQDWEAWASAAGVDNLNSRKDSNKVKTFYRENKGTLNFPNEN